MIDRLASAPGFFDPTVRIGAVGVEQGNRFGVGLDLLSEGRLLGVGADDQAKLPAGPGPPTRASAVGRFRRCPVRAVCFPSGGAGLQGQDAGRLFSPTAIAFNFQR